MAELSHNHKVALDLAQAGMFVLPCNPANKRALIESWPDKASDNLDDINDWWTKYPEAAPAIACGKSNIVVLDLDRHSDDADGVAAFKKLVEQNGSIDGVPVTKTPNDGFHIYFSQPVNGSRLNNSRGDLDKGIDVRGEGGYVIAPDARISNDRGYIPVSGTPKLREITSNGGLKQIPKWLVSLIRPERNQQANGYVSQQKFVANGEPDVLEEALKYIPSDDREIWLKIGGALFDTGQPWARSLWDDWAAQSAKFNPADQEITWRSFARQTGSKASVGSIIHIARQNGYSRIFGTDTSSNSRVLDTRERTADQWPDPKPLPNGLLPVDPFDLDFLPSRIAPWVGDIAERLQCPLDFVAIPALVALATVVGRKVGIRPQLHTDWIEVPNIWGCIVGRPGMMKSPAIKEAMKFVNRLEQDARKIFENQRAEYERGLELAKIAKTEAMEAARKAIKAGRDGSIEMNVQMPEEPKATRFIINDTSYEKLGEILADNPNGIVAFRDELVSLLRTLDREDNAAARGFFLTAWNGTSGYQFDRITRGQTYIEAACLSLLGGTQPGRLSEYIRRANDGGASDDGLIQRFGLLVWPDQSPEWRDVDRYPNSEARQSAMQVFNRLAEIDPIAIGAEIDEFDSIPYLRFDAEAHEIFLEWRLDLEKRIRADDISAPLESHFGKYRKLAPSLALLNHLTDGGEGPVTATATLRAISLMSYLETHARRVYAAGIEGEVRAAKAILKRIKKGFLQNGFSARDIRRKEWTELTDNKQIEEGLALLCDLDWVSPITVTTGGRGKTTYSINPKVLV